MLPSLSIVLCSGTMPWRYGLETLGQPAVTAVSYTAGKMTAEMFVTKVVY